MVSEFPSITFRLSTQTKPKNSANSLLCSILQLWNVYVCFEKDGFCADAYIAVFAQLSNKLAFKTI